MLNWLFNIHSYLLILFNSIILENDAAEPWQIGFQEVGSLTAKGIHDLHNDIFFYLIIILVMVIWILFKILSYWRTSKNLIEYKYENHGQILEFFWTVTPALILIAISFPSFKLLYLMDEVIDSTITIKVTGRQWYWSYEFSDYSEGDIAFDSYMIPTEELSIGQLRLLEVDNRVIVPVDTHIRFLITAADVIHSWAVPSLGLKIDAIPGRLNQTSTFIEREGVFYGQCSELCGVYHGFMPIVIEAVTLEKYLIYISGELTDLG